MVAEMRREFSAGGVLVRRMRAGTWALPKGLIGAGERGPETAVRETFEETGVRAAVVQKLGDTRYVYTWAGERVFKVVSFFLLRPVGGRLGELPAGMEVEVAEARWLPLADAPRLLAYRGEREMTERAAEALLAGEGDASVAPTA
jgi:8-oxo-dGTP pyrophosphatase MutT (NUDIX family)